MIAITGEAVQFTRDAGEMRCLGEGLPSLHDEHQEKLDESHHVQRRPFVTSQRALQGRREVRVQQRLFGGRKKREKV